MVREPTILFHNESLLISDTERRVFFLVHNREVTLVEITAAGRGLEMSYLEPAVKS